MTKPNSDVVGFLAGSCVMLADIQPYIPGFTQNMINYSLPYGVTVDGLLHISARLLIYRTAEENKLVEIRSSPPSAYHLCRFLNLATSVPCRPIFTAMNMAGLTFQFCSNRTVLDIIQSLGGKYSAYRDFDAEADVGSCAAHPSEGFNFAYMRVYLIAANIFDNSLFCHLSPLHQRQTCNFVLTHHMGWLFRQSKLCLE